MVSTSSKVKSNMIDLRQSADYANFLSKDGWKVERINNTNYFLRKLPILGSVLKLQRPKLIDFKKIEEIQKRNRVFLTIIEPNLETTFVNSSHFNHNLLLHHGFKLAKSTYLPSKTIQINLTKTKNEIYASFSKSARYSIKRGEDLKIKEYSSLKEIEIFHDAWKKSVNFNRYVPSLKTLLNLKKSFPHNHSIFLASHNKSSRIIGGAIFTISSHDSTNYITYYMYGFTNKEGRTSLSQYSLLYSGILWGKSQGCKLFDMEGIFDERFPNKSWLGFSHFKKQFGGSIVTYPGCYTKYSIFK